VVATLPATRLQVIESINWLIDAEEAEQAFFMVTDHGHPEGISLWGQNQFLSLSELSSLLNTSSILKVLVLGQCYSGIFAESPPQRSIVCCACKANEVSLPVPRTRMLPGVEPNYNEFLYQFVGAMLGSYPDNVPLTEPLVVPAQGNVTIDRKSVV